MATENPRFIVAKGRYSWKRHGRTGWGWWVIDTLKGTSAGHADEQAAAEAEARRFNEGAA